MEGLSEEEIIEEFETFGFHLSKNSPLLDKLLDIGRTYQLTAETLNEEWVAYSTRQGGCKLDLDTLDQWEGDLIKSTRKTPSSRRSVAKATPARQPVYVEEMETLTEENLDEMFGSVSGGNVGNGMEVVDSYSDRMSGKKRFSETTPTHAPPPSKIKPRQQNGSTPRTPNGNTTTHNGHHTPSHHHTPHHSANTTTPFRLMAESGMLSNSPQATYSQRQNSGNVMCSLNPDLLPREWAGSEVKVHIQHYNAESAVTKPYLFMYQKSSEKAQILLEWIQEMGGAICNQHDLPSPLPINQPSLEPAVYVGMVVCEGEGHLNVRSCLLEGVSHGSHMYSRGACVRLQIPDSLACSLFPGQVIAVEGVNNYNGIMVPTRIYDQGVLPPLPMKAKNSSQGLTILCAAGPFSTTDSLTFQPLADLLKVVVREKPNLLILVGPFLDSAHPHVKNCEIPGNLTYEEFFKSQVLNKILKVTHSTKTRTVLLPSQRDAHHPWEVYPQPPFTCVGEEGHAQGTGGLFCASDPSILDINGLCVGATSVDILFHLSANIMVRGSVGDRMARVASHILQQKSFYPLLPASTEVNLDLLEKSRTSLSVRPHLLLLPSNLKPFAKEIDGCTVVNPGHLTKGGSGGTYCKIVAANSMGVQIVHL